MIYRIFSHYDFFMKDDTNLIVEIKDLNEENDFYNCKILKVIKGAYQKEYRHSFNKSFFKVIKVPTPDDILKEIL